MNSSELLFTELCNENYLKGFVYHSPKYIGTSEVEIGDVVLYSRFLVIAFEIIYRDKKRAKSNKTESFRKRIGEKREQLIKDFKKYTSEDSLPLTMINQNGERVLLNSSNNLSFCGVVIVDCEDELGALDYQTIEMSLSQKFPICISKKEYFLFVIKEANTIPDLLYYLQDRFDFLKKVYKDSSIYFRNLDIGIDKHLMSLYKMNNYKLPIEIWNKSKDKNFYQEFVSSYKEKIDIRDDFIEKSKLIDWLIDLIQKQSKSSVTIDFTDQLAHLIRSIRCQLATKIEDSIEKIRSGKKERFFAFYNDFTGCWLVFYFQSEGTMEELIKKTDYYTKMNLFYQIGENKFEFSVFGYGFIFLNEKNISFFKTYLTVEDADDYTHIDADQIEEARRTFGYISCTKTEEFPNNKYS